MSNRKTEISVVLPFFPGFYESILSEIIDDVIENKSLEENEDIEELYGKYDFKRAFLLMSNKWVENFNTVTGLNVKFTELDSPREYNFVTDRIFGTIDEDEFQKIRDSISFDDLEAIVKSRFTSYDGFVSFYTTDMDHWMNIRTSDLDHNEAETFIIAYLGTDTFNAYTFIDGMAEVAENCW